MTDDIPADFTPAMRDAATTLIARKYTLALLRQKYPMLRAIQTPASDEGGSDG